MNKIKVNSKTYEYANEVSVGQFQKVINLIHDINEIVAEPDMTAGKFVGYLSSKERLLPFVAILLEAPQEEIEKFPINKAIEVCNNFFYANGFWLMISNHFSMPSEVEEMLKNPQPTKQTPTTHLQNLEESLTKDGKQTKKKNNTESD